MKHTYFSTISFLVVLLTLPAGLFGQADSLEMVLFDFNEHEIKEANNKFPIKSYGVTLTNDRFGNENSAAYLHGNSSSYINLGTSNLLKSKAATISMWVNVQHEVSAGKGYRSNPLLLIKNGEGEDFIYAYGIGYSPIIKRVGAQATLDSTREVMVFARDTLTLNRWYHIVMTSDFNYFSFYVNGNLQGRMVKDFETSFLEGDSVILGRSTGSKNERFSHAILDDIRFYNRVLSEQEIVDLHYEPNPNYYKDLIFKTAKYIAIIITLIIIIILLLIRNRAKLKKQKEFYELNNRIKELEIKVIKAQINPHFISNCLTAIQNLILSKQVDKASDYLSLFSVFLRKVLDFSDQTYITLAQELSVINLNIELEELRFKSDFSYEVVIDPSLSIHEILIPCLITQPFIENAIWHGLLPLKNRKPTLTIKVYRLGLNVYISIEDNGVGRKDPEVLSDKSNKGTKLAKDKIESINQLNRNTDYDLEILDLFDTHNAPAGTKIIIRLSTYTQDE